MTKLRIGLCSALILPRIPRWIRGERTPADFYPGGFRIVAGAFSRHRVAHLVLWVVERGSSSILSKSLPEYSPPRLQPGRRARSAQKLIRSRVCDG
jgi:hypothetical protein